MNEEKQIEKRDLMSAVKDWIRPENIIKNMSFLMFLAVLLVIYITNSHYQLQLERKIDAKERELKTLRWEYMSVKSDVMYASKQSEVEKAVASIGLKPLKEEPILIVE